MERLEHPEEVQARVLERARWLVEAESPSGDAVRVRALAERTAPAFEELGGRAALLDAPGWGSHVRVEFPGADSSLEPVVLLGHLDTVHPVGSLAEQPFRVLDGRAEGPGIYDMKANIAIMLETLAGLSAAERKARRPVVVLLTCDEESGSPTGRPVIEETARGARAVLVVEPSLPGGGVKTARKGVATYRLELTGRAAHAGVEPEKGASAIHELAQQILLVLSLGNPHTGTTINVGVVGGGTATNVVAAHAWAEIDVRYATETEWQRVDFEMQALQAGVSSVQRELRLTDRRPPLERTPAVVGLYEQARLLAQELGFDLAEGSTGGGSDGCFTAAIGIPTLDGLGVDGGGAHAAHEYIKLADIPRRVALLTRLLQTL